MIVVVYFYFDSDLKAATNILKYPNSKIPWMSHPTHQNAVFNEVFL